MKPIGVLACVAFVASAQALPILVREFRTCVDQS